jgi:hypothetical protein
MTINLTGQHRDRFIAELRAHRERFSISDAQYAGQVLKVSLNTYKKCVRPAGKAPLKLKRYIFISVCARVGLDPKAYGLSIGIPAEVSSFGGYRKDDYEFLSGRFFLYRRSFLTARHITRSILEIYPSDTKECLEFHELHYYVSESGVRDEQHYDGDVHLNQERSVLSMPAYFGGQVRLTLLLMPEHADGKRRPLKMRGAALVFGIPRGYWQPTVSCVFVEGPIENKRPNPKDLCSTISAGTEEYARLAAELAHAEEHATIMTPLMWSKLQSKQD